MKILYYTYFCTFSKPMQYDYTHFKIWNCAKLAQFGIFAHYKISSKIPAKPRYFNVCTAFSTLRHSALLENNAQALKMHNIYNFAKNDICN